MHRRKLSKICVYCDAGTRESDLPREYTLGICDKCKQEKRRDSAPVCPYFRTACKRDGCLAYDVAFERWVKPTSEELDRADEPYLARREKGPYCHALKRGLPDE